MNFVLLSRVGGERAIATLEVSELVARLKMIDDGLHGDSSRAVVAFCGVEVVHRSKVFDKNVEAVVLRVAN